MTLKSRNSKKGAGEAGAQAPAKPKVNQMTATKTIEFDVVSAYKMGALVKKEIAQKKTELRRYVDGEFLRFAYQTREEIAYLETLLEMFKEVSSIGWSDTQDGGSK